MSQEDRNDLDPERVIDAICGTPTVRAAVEALHPFDRRLLGEAIQEATRGAIGCIRCAENIEAASTAQAGASDLRDEVSELRDRMDRARNAL